MANTSQMCDFDPIKVTKADCIQICANFTFSGILSSDPLLACHAGVHSRHPVQPRQHPGAHPQGHEEPRQHDPHRHRCRRLPQ